VLRNVKRPLRGAEERDSRDHGGTRRKEALLHEYSRTGGPLQFSELSFNRIAVRLGHLGGDSEVVIRFNVLLAGGCSRGEVPNCTHMIIQLFRER